MARWKHGRAAVLGGAAVAVVWAVVAVAAPAQNPLPKTQLDFFLPPEALPKAEPEKLPPLDLTTIHDENVEPAAAKQPAGTPARPGSNPPRTGTEVPDPPHPVVTVRVRVPADMAPGDDIKYIITVQNISSADAHGVTVRNPIAVEVDGVVKADPMPDKTSTDKQLIWVLGTMKGGTTKKIELTLRHKPGVTELKNLAYVKYEHGQSVTTKLAKPTIKVSKTAPKQTVRDEAYSVRITLENAGKVPAENVRVIENLPASAEVEAITAGGKKLAQPEGQQWEWEIAKLQPGERKSIEYRVTPRAATDVFTLTSVSGPKVVADRPAEARTQVLVPGLEVKLTGPAAGAPVNAGESAKYEIVVRNTGTLTSTNVKVTGSIPADCKPTMKTDGGQIVRDTIVWTIPKLEPGEAQAFRLAVKASTTGRRVVVASATDARGMKAGQELATVFTGTAALVWETKFDTHTVQVDKQGVFTVKVKNNGGEAARNVRVQITVPDAVTVVQWTPKTQINGTAIAFEPETIPGYGEVTYTLTFQGKKADQAWFTVRMAADCLGDRPMQTEKMAEIIGGPK